MQQNYKSGDPIGFIEMQRLQTEILCEVDRFCRKNDITYFIAYGTLLGAVRHGGHIPWDDDSDIVIPRPEYERFLKEYKENENYRVVTYDNEDALLYNFARLVNKKTGYRGKGEYEGIFIDIYPLDGLPDNDIKRLNFLKRMYRRIDLQRFLVRVYNGLSRRNIPYVPSIVLSIIKKFNEKLDNAVTKYSYDESTYVANIVGEPYKRVLPRNIFCRSDILFDGETLVAPLGKEDFLHIMYNDYMQLPPEEKRIPYHGCDYFWR